MSSTRPHHLRTLLRSAMTRSMKERDREATAVYRSVLGAIDNAEAVTLDDSHRAGAIETATIGAGRSDVRRRELTEQDVAQVVVGEARERREAADQLEATRPEDAERLRREARLLTAVLDAVHDD